MGLQDFKRVASRLDAIISEEFIVQSMSSIETKAMTEVDTAPRNEFGSMIIDGKPFDDLYGDYAHMYVKEVENGYRNTHSLTVKPIKKSCPITTIIFTGPTPQLTSERLISAKIPLDFFIPGREHTIEWYKKKCKEKETAIEIISLEKNLQAFHIARSAEYDNYFRKF